MLQSRQLAAIMFTDIVGYTALMGNDEQRAFQILKKNRDLQKPVIEEYNGRWIKELGDGVMASFNTVSDAINAGLKIQEACNSAKEFQLRIGIHLGEVVFENDDVFGDGVNIAARIQAIANPGSIFVSESVHNNISNKQGIASKFVKQETLKNVKEPVRIYEVMASDIQTTSFAAESIHPVIKNISEKSIAVLPFVNMSNDPEQEYFNDGLTAEIIASLSKLKDMRIISRTTSMHYKNSVKDIQTIGRELSVQYIMEGSVRKSQDNLRITAQLIDVGNDKHLWAETYKGMLADVFDIQEQVSREIVDALRIRLTPTEVVILTSRSTENPEAFDYYLRARNFLYRRTKNTMLFAIQLFQKAIDLEPTYAAAHAGLGETYATFYQQFERKEIWLEKAIESGLRALIYDSTSSVAYSALGLAYFNKGNIDEAQVATQKAIELDRNDFAGYWILGRIYSTTDRSREAVDQFKKVIEIYPDFYTAYYDLMVVYEKLGEKEKYDELTDKAFAALPGYISKHPDDARSHMYYAVMLMLKGNKGDAKEEATKALELSPNDPVMFFNAACFYARYGEIEIALKMITNAVSIGFEHYEWLKRDTDLDSLRNEPEFIEIMKGK